MEECHFWANVILRQSRLWASRVSPAQKSQGLRVVSSKNFSRCEQVQEERLELVSKELHHFGVIADLFRQIWGHGSRFVLFCSF